MIPDLGIASLLPFLGAGAAVILGLALLTTEIRAGAAILVLAAAALIGALAWHQYDAGGAEVCIRGTCDQLRNWMQG